MPDLSVIIPTYNEAANIGATTESVVAWLDTQDMTWEVLLVDDGSTDDTLEIERQLVTAHTGVRTLAFTPNHGKGYVVRQGMLAAKGDVRLFLDADYSTPIEELDLLLPPLRGDADIAIGTRRTADARIETKPPFHRYFLGEVYIRMTSLLLGSRISDFNCGFKAFRAEAAERLFALQRRNDWSFDAEALVLAERLGYTIAEAPVRWAHVQATSKVHPVRDGIRSFLALLAIWWDLKRGLYGEGEDDGCDCQE